MEGGEERKQCLAERSRGKRSFTKAQASQPWIHALSLLSPFVRLLRRLTTAAGPCGTRAEAADFVSSPENCEQVAACPRRNASDFHAFPSSRFAAWTAWSTRPQLSNLSQGEPDVSIHSRPIRRLTPQPTDRGRADCPSLKGGGTEKDFIGFAVLSTTRFPLKGEVSNHKGIFDEIFRSTPLRRKPSWAVILL